MAAGLDIGTLSGRIELEDRLSTALDLAMGKLDAFDRRFGGVGQRIAEGAASFFTAAAALEGIKFAAGFAADALARLTVEGAGAADIEENFDRMNAAAGRLGETLVSKLREGLHGTVTDLEIMKTVNKDLAAGMNLTDEQFETLAKGAFALAQATGTNVKDALDKMNDAMLTGRTRAVALLTGKIDLEAAEKKFAISLKTTADRLTEEEKLEAARLAILEKVTNATQRLGEQTDGIDEFVAQAQVAWANFQTELGKSIATSPVIMAGFVGIRDAILEAFGGTQEAAVKRITQAVNNAAIGVLSFAQSVVDGAAIAHRSLLSLAIIFESVVQGWRAIGIALATVSFEDESKTIDLLYDKLAQGDAKITKLRQAQDEWAVSTGKVNEKIEEIRQKMIAANQKLKEGEQVTLEVAKANDVASASAAVLSDNLRHTAEEAKKYAEALVEMKDADAALSKGISATKQILEGVSDEVTRNVKKYLEAGIALDKLTLAYRLTDKQAQAIQETWKEEKKKVDDVNQAWDELNKLGHTVEQTLRGVSSVVIDQVKRFIEVGASLDVLKRAYGLTDAQIRAITETLKASEAAFTEQNAQVQKQTELVRTLAGEWIVAAEAKERTQLGGSFEINRGNLKENLKFWGVPEDLGFKLAEKGFSFQEILEAWRTKTWDKWVPAGPRIPGFKEGGVGDFGDGTLAMLHGREAIVPLDKAESIGDTNVTIFVNGTAEETARKIKDIFIKDLTQGRQFSIGKN